MRTGPAAWVAMLILLGALSAGLAQEVRLGDSADAVRKALGEPRGSIKSGAYEQLQYERGWVELRTGRVTRVQMMSPEKAAARQAEKEQRWADQRAADAARDAQLQAEGIAERDRMLADPRFLALPASDQLSFWESFRTRYPDVAVDAGILAALAQRQKDRKDEELQQLRAKIAEMEQRLARAEARADQAVQQALEAGNRNRSFAYYDVNPWPIYLRYQPPQVFSHPGHPGPGKATDAPVSTDRPGQPRDIPRDTGDVNTGPGSLRFSF